MSLDSMIAQANKTLGSVELVTYLKKVNYKEGGEKVTLIFYADSIKSDFRKTYDVQDRKGLIDFNRAMSALGAKTSNYSKWLSKMSEDKTPITLSVSPEGFVRMIRVVDTAHKLRISKLLFLDTIEGSEHWSTEDIETLVNNFTLKELMKEMNGE